MNKECPKFLKKQPRQTRAKATVEAILEAATYILLHDGQNGFNTNHIAEKAGVSIASLYQYFTDKNAILSELQRRHVEKTRANAMQIGQRYKNDSLAVLIGRMIESGIAAHTADPDLHRIFGNIVSEIQTNDQEPTSDTFHFHDVKESLETHGMTHEEAEFTVWLFRTVVHAAIHEGTYNRHDDIVSGRLAKALNIMIMSWLEKSLKTKN